MNAGKYNKKIEIYRTVDHIDEDGFSQEYGEVILTCYAEVKTTKGFTLIANGSDFEKAYTRFTIRYPVTEIKRTDILVYRDKEYSIEYINNVDEADTELELQCKEITH